MIRPYYETANGKLYNANCLDILPELERVDLTITSPPYDNLREYNGYYFHFCSIALDLYKITKDGGVVVWIVGDATINGSETGTSFKQALYFKDIGFNLHDTMIYKMPGTGAKGSNLCYWQAFEYMFVLTKGRIKTVNRLKDKLNIKAGTKCTSGIIQKNTGTRLHPAGGTIVSKYGIRDNVWVIPSGNGHGDITGHPAVFPSALAQDHILSWSNEGNTVLDPMSGSGTVPKMCERLNRKWLACEISEEYAEISAKRIEAEASQLKLFT